jgi:hypothetical protein
MNYVVYYVHVDNIVTLMQWVVKKLEGMVLTERRYDTQLLKEEARIV